MVFISFLYFREHLLKKYHKGLLWEFTGPSYLLRSRLLKQESHLTVYQCSISHTRPLTLLGVLGRRQQRSAAGAAIQPLISCLKLPYEALRKETFNYSSLLKEKKTKKTQAPF